MAEDGEVGQVGELGQCHGHVVLHTDLVEVDRCRTYSRIFKSYSIRNNLWTTMTMASSLIKQLFVFGLEDGQWTQDGEVGQVGELGQCHGHVVEVDQIWT